ncbi:MAG: S41 family peptidase [Chlorobiaceae bacterium]|nr:S41 family peptidase [Chlorobiaceae bacterium]
MSRIFSAVLMIVVLAFGIFIGSRLNGGRDGVLEARQKKVQDAYRLIRSSYVDPVNDDSLASAGIRGMVESLDPHTIYLEPEKAAYSNAELEGNFEGVGIEFDVVNDTLLVVTPLAGGPSESAGIMPGDRILAIDSVNAVGITRESVLRKLRGKSGTRVALRVFRPFAKRTIDFMVTRGKISTSSIDAAFMLDGKTGYVRISKFVETTAREFHDALLGLRGRGMGSLVIDLRGNPGGFLDQAVQVADELLPERNLIVYTKSRHGGADELRYSAKPGGLFEKGPVCLLVDRGSASAAEILAGALQDNHRASLVGELTFGKGLVQRQFEFSDGSALRLTVSRYYTPSGRQIQRGYDEGSHGREAYYRQMNDRSMTESLLKKLGGALYLESGDLKVFATGNAAWGVKAGDSLKAVLAKAGGIMPDYWVTGRPYTNLYQELFAKGVFEDISLKLIDDPSGPVSNYRSSSDAFVSGYAIPADLESRIRAECRMKKIVFNSAEYARDAAYIKVALKARVARQLFGTEGQLKVLIRESDPAMRAARQIVARMAS